MQKEQALKVIRKLCEKAQKKGLISSLEDSEEVKNSLFAIAFNLETYDRELSKAKEQNEAYKNTNNELIEQNKKLSQENESLKKHIEYKNENLS